MKIHCWTIVLFFLGTTNGVRAQAGVQLFDDAVLHEIRLHIDIPEWLDTLYSDYSTANTDLENIPEVYRRCDSVLIDGTAINPIGIKMKGNFSVLYNWPQQKTKFPFKLSFNEFYNQRYDGLNKVNLNTNTNDPSFMHEAMSYKLFRQMGQAAPRTAYTRLYINDAYYGLYLLVENIDKTFLKYHLDGDNDGNLYKGLTSGLEWEGGDKSAYKQGLSLKTNENEDDWTRLIQFIDLINNAPDDSIRNHLENVFDLDAFLRIVAVERLVFSWDSYSGSGANYYIYEQNDGKILWVPWDYNESFQIADGKITPSYLVPRTNRPLLKAVFEQKEWRQRYMDIVCEILESGRFSVDSLLPQFKAWHHLIDESYRSDPNTLLDYALFLDCLNAPTREYAAFPRTGLRFRVITYNGLFPFIRERVKWAKKQLALQGFECAVPMPDQTITNLEAFPNPIRSAEILKVVQPRITQETSSRITLFDALGQIVAIEGWTFCKDGLQEIAIGALPQGVYFLLKEEANGIRGITKIIKI